MSAAATAPLCRPPTPHCPVLDAASSPSQSSSTPSQGEPSPAPTPRDLRADSDAPISARNSQVKYPSGHAGAERLKQMIDAALAVLARWPHVAVRHVGLRQRSGVVVSFTAPDGAEAIRWRQHDDALLIPIGEARGWRRYVERARPPRGCIGPRQAEVLARVAAHVAARGMPPTFVELGEQMGIGSRAVGDLVAKLRRHRLVERGDGRSRTLRIVQQASSTGGRAADTSQR